MLAYLVFPNIRAVDAICKDKASIKYTLFAFNS